MTHVESQERLLAGVLGEGGVQLTRSRWSTGFAHLFSGYYCGTVGPLP